jgi:uncharacterized protein YjbI with pentapeptide repeats
LEVLNQTPFHFAPIAGRVNFPNHSLTLIVKGTFELSPGQKVTLAEEQLYPTGDGHHPGDDEMQGSPRYESDFAYFKPRADLLLVGTCHAPGGEPVRTCRVTFQVGTKSRSLLVFGDRSWRRNAAGLWMMTDPEPFAEMALRYENSFGGEGYKKNPVGKGFLKEEAKSENKEWMLPNIEDPNSRVNSEHSRPEPAGFGPLGRMWEERYSKLGTYGGNYLKERWPWFAEDFDTAHFNAAPPEMQLEGFLRGDETLYFENLHPDYLCYESGLPGLRARCFLNKLAGPETDQTHFDEVPMNLDTLWVDMDDEKLVLVWRGWTEVRSEDYDEVGHVFIMSEPLDQPPQSVENCYPLFVAALAEYERAWEMTPEEPEAPETATEPGPDALAEAEAKEKAREELVKRVEAQTAAIFSQVGIDLERLPSEVREKAKEKQAGIIRKLTEDDPEKVMAMEREEIEDQMKDAFTKMGVDTDKLPPITDKAKAEQARFMKELGLGDMDIGADEDLSRFWAMMAVVFPKMGIDPENLTPLIEEAKKHQDRIKKEFGLEEEEEAEEAEVAPPLTREVVQERLVRGESLVREDLSGLDLSGLEMKGVDFSEAILAGAVLKQADLSGANLTNANLAGADLFGANLTGANLAGADLSSANLENACLKDADATGGNLTEAKLAGAVLTDALFEKARMGRAILDQVEAGGVYFTEADLNGASFRSGELTGSDFSGCLLHGANFQGANLTEANVYGAQGTQVNFGEANLTGFRASAGCDFSQGSFVRASGLESAWHGANLAGADFSFSQMEGADFTKASLEAANFYAANMKFSRFVRADLRQAKLVKMNLFEGSLAKADLTEADFSGSNLYGAEFLDAIVERTVLDGANLKRTKLSRG